MKFRCRCGGVFEFPEQQERLAARCAGCGRMYELVEADGRLKARPVAMPEQGPAGAAPPEKKTDELDILDEDEYYQAPAAPGPAGVDAAGGDDGLALVESSPGREVPPPPHATAMAPDPVSVRVGPLVDGREQEEAVQHSFWYYFGDCWAYPFRGNIPLALIGWPLMALSLSFLPFGGIMAFGLLALYEFALIRQSAWDANARPSLPAWEGFYDSIFVPIGRWIVICLASALPFLAVITAANMVGGIGIRGAIVAIAGVISGVFTFVPLLQLAAWGIALLVGLILSFLIFPMNILAVAAADSVGALSPQFTFPAAAKVIGPYLVFWIFAMVVTQVANFGTVALSTLIGGGYVSAVVAMVIRIYTLTVCARVLGALHFVYSRRMGWVT